MPRPLKLLALAVLLALALATAALAHPRRVVVRPHPGRCFNVLIWFSWRSANGRLHRLPGYVIVCPRKRTVTITEPSAIAQL